MSVSEKEISLEYEGKKYDIFKFFGHPMVLYNPGDGTVVMSVEFVADNHGHKTFITKRKNGAFQGITTAENVRVSLRVTNLREKDKLLINIRKGSEKGPEVNEINVIRAGETVTIDGDRSAGNKEIFLDSLKDENTGASVSVNQDEANGVKNRKGTYFYIVVTPMKRGREWGEGDPLDLSDAVWGCPSHYCKEKKDRTNGWGGGIPDLSFGGGGARRGADFGDDCSGIGFGSGGGGNDFSFGSGGGGGFGWGGGMDRPGVRPMGERRIASSGGDGFNGVRSEFGIRAMGGGSVGWGSSPPPAPPHRPQEEEMMGFAQISRPESPDSPGFSPRSPAYSPVSFCSGPPSPKYGVASSVGIDTNRYTPESGIMTGPLPPDDDDDDDQGNAMATSPVFDYGNEASAAVIRHGLEVKVSSAKVLEDPDYLHRSKPVELCLSILRPNSVAVLPEMSTEKKLECALECFHQFVTDKNRFLLETIKKVFPEEECTICLTEAPNIVFAKCGHKAICGGCDKQLKDRRCTQCRAVIVAAIKT